MPRPLHSHLGPSHRGPSPPVSNPQPQAPPGVHLPLVALSTFSISPSAGGGVTLPSGAAPAHQALEALSTPTTSTFASATTTCSVLSLGVAQPSATTAGADSGGFARTPCIAAPLHVQMVQRTPTPPSSPDPGVLSSPEISLASLSRRACTQQRPKRPRQLSPGIQGSRKNIRPNRNLIPGPASRHSQDSGALSVQPSDEPSEQRPLSLFSQSTAFSFSAPVEADGGVDRPIVVDDNDDEPELLEYFGEQPNEQRPSVLGLQIHFQSQEEPGNGRNYIPSNHRPAPLPQQSRLGAQRQTNYDAQHAAQAQVGSLMDELVAQRQAHQEQVERIQTEHKAQVNRIVVALLAQTQAVTRAQAETREHAALQKELVASVQADVASLRTELRDMSNTVLKHLKAKADKLEETIGRVETDVSKIDDCVLQVTRLRTSVDTQSTQFTGIKPTVEGGLGTIKSTMEALGEKMSEMGLQFNNINHHIPKIAEVVKTLSTKEGGPSGQTSIRDEITEPFHPNDTQLENLTRILQTVQSRSGTYTECGPEQPTSSMSSPSAAEVWPPSATQQSSAGATPPPRTTTPHSLPAHVPAWVLPVPKRDSGFQQAPPRRNPYGHTVNYLPRPNTPREVEGTRNWTTRSSNS